MNEDRYLNYMHMVMGNGHVTCAIDHPIHSKVSGLVHVGVAFCSPKDIFVKSKGREKAVGRLRTHGPMTFSFTSAIGVPFKAQVHDILFAMANGEVLDNVFNLKVAIPNWAQT